MLQAIRDRAQGVLVWVIVGLIIVTFALFGLGSYLTGDSKTVAAKVNGAEITENQLLQARQNYVQRMQQMLGDQFDPRMFESAALRQEVLDALITRELIKLHLDKAGYAAEPMQVVELIRSMPVFQDQARFSLERYQQVLRMQAMTSETLEQSVAEDLIMDQLHAGIVETDFVTPHELERYLMLRNQQRDVGYMVFRISDYVAQAQPDETEIENFYQANRAAFMTPEQVSVDYVEMDISELAAQFEADDSGIRQYYDTYRHNYLKQPEQRRARHILLSVDENRDVEATRQQAEELLARLRQGESFEELARIYSADPGSALQGGDLGYFGRGVMVPAFDSVVFALQPGEVSEPVRTRFGYHLIRLESVQPEVSTPLDDVREEIRKELQLMQAEQVFYNRVDELNRLSYEMPDSLQELAQQLELEIKHSPLFSREGSSDLFADPRVIEAAFSEEVLGLGRNSQLLELADTRVMVLRLREHVPARQLALSDVRPVLVEQLKRQQARRLALESAQQAYSALQQGREPQQVAQSFKADWQRPGFVSRSPEREQTLDEALRDQLFRLPRPSDTRPAVAQVQMNTGDIAVLQLFAVRDAPAQLEPARLQAERRRLVSAFGTASYEALLSSLREQAKVRLNN